MAEEKKSVFYCSFCGKSQDQVAKIIAGPTVFICDECVYLCLDILKHEGVEDKHPELTEEQGEAMAFEELQTFFGTSDKASTIRRMAAIARAAKPITTIKK